MESAVFLEALGKEYTLPLLEVRSDVTGLAQLAWGEGRSK
jgi:hypothetical protein